MRSLVRSGADVLLGCLLKGQEGSGAEGMDENIVEVMDH